jgi:hypothetical protein
MTLSSHSSASYQTFVAEPYTPNTGSTLQGLDLSQPLSELAQTELLAGNYRFKPMSANAASPPPRATLRTSAMGRVPPETFRVAATAISL